MLESKIKTFQFFEEEGNYNEGVANFSHLHNIVNNGVEWLVDLKKEIRPIRVQFKPQDYGKVRTSLQKTAGVLYNLTEKDSVSINRIYVIPNCTYNPFMVEVTINGKIDKRFYLKNPVPERFFGKALYNILLDGKYTRFVFSETGLAVDEVPGSLQSWYDSNKNQREKKMLTNNTTYLTNLIKIGVFASSIFLADLNNPDNFTVDSAKDIHLLDFDQCFRLFDYSLFKLYAPEGKDQIAVREVTRLERQKIGLSIRRNKQRLDQLLQALSEHDINEEFANKSGFDNIGELIRVNLARLEGSCNLNH